MGEEHYDVVEKWVLDGPLNRVSGHPWEPEQPTLIPHPTHMIPPCGHQGQEGRGPPDH